MTKLKDLSEKELSGLLNLPLDKAREWLKVAKTISDEKEQPWFDDWFGEFHSATSIRRSSVKELMWLSVEEVEQLQRTGEFYRRYPSFKRKVPKDAETRLRYLRELLKYEREFMARYPAACELLFGAYSSGGGLRLPSFDVRILRNAPQMSILPAGWWQTQKLAQDSGDAFSFTIEKKDVGEDEVDQSHPPLDIGHMRGVLLAVLSREIDQSYPLLDIGHMRGVLLSVLGREEYAERIATELHDEAIREELGAPTRSTVRITDLRLATAPELKDPEYLKKALLPLLKSLGKPVTQNAVLQWKWGVLWTNEEERGQRSEAAEAEIIRVSFAAAALLLFMDFGMPDIEHARPYRLAEHIGELARIVQTLSKSLNANANKLEKLLAYRAQNRPSTQGQEFYEALCKYRMGIKPSRIAKDLGLTPYKSSPSEPGGSDMGGTKDWKSRLEEKLSSGATIEKQKYPHAAAVFANRHKPRIARKACMAYRTYWEETWQYSQEEHSPWPKTGTSIRVSTSTDWGLEVLKAYVQLGSCLEQQLEPFPTRSDFNS